MPRKKKINDDMPAQVFCNVIADGDGVKVDECMDIMDHNPDPIKKLEKTFGKTRVQKEVRAFSRFIEVKPPKKKKSPK